MYILGISAYYHDSSACLVKDGKILAAVQEERFTRIKHDPAFPCNAINYCLDFASINPKEIDYIVFYDKPFLKFERLLETYLAFAPRGLLSFIKSIPIWLKEKLFQKNVISLELQKMWPEEMDWGSKLLFSEHHLSHAASAFFPSPFEEAAVLTMDGVGEWTTTSLAIGLKNNLSIIKEIHFPHSLGLLYSAFTYYTGFKVNSGEYKVMGLAPYGVPRYAQIIKDNIVDIKEDGSFFLDMSYFDYCAGSTMTSNKFHNLFGGPPRQSESEITQKEMDLAASIQSVTEEIIIRLAKDVASKTGHKNLCLAGGVALNCVANGKLLREKIFENIWIQPAAGDAGGSVGAALAVYYMMLDQPRIIDGQVDGMSGTYLGPEFTQEQIESSLKKIGASYSTYEIDELIERVALELADGKAVGWMNGRMEFGPRSLGGRSILADPRSPNMQRLLNLKVKYRESFRPFAPSVLVEDLSEWFEIDCDSPYMLFVAKVDKKKCFNMTEKEGNLFGIEKLNVLRSTIPSVTHVDYTARIQTVHKSTNPIFHRLIERFKGLTGFPILINTSFNVRGEPIVCSPEDAFKCFMGTGLDVLVIGRSILIKSDQDGELFDSYVDRYELD